jgi:predicted outer membrane repeat protein
MFNGSSDVTLTDCSITGNRADFGGGIYNEDNEPTFTGCTFSGNFAFIEGGGMNNWLSFPRLTDCVFLNNSAGIKGGGIQSFYSHIELLVNCKFSGNRTEGDGGAICVEGGSAPLDNCTLAGNLAGQKGGGIVLLRTNAGLENCILWGNSDSDGVDESAQIYLLPGDLGTFSLVFHYSCVQGWTGDLGGTGMISDDPCFMEPGYWDANGTPTDATDDFWVDGDYHLLDGSACIDAGDNAVVPPSVTTDLEGNLRIRGGIVDMGAYESRVLFFVDIDAAGADNGSSWADAFNYLQDALMVVSVGDEIRVAEGTYKPDQFVLSDRPNLGRAETFQLTNGVTIKGGYAGFGEPDPDARDIDLYKTVLSGDLNGDDVEVNDPCDLLTDPSRADNCYHVVTTSEFNYYGPNIVLDGFTITGGNADGQYPDWELGAGGGMYNDNSSPTVLNCTFTENSARGNGGGVDNFGSWPTLINCTFSRNFSSWGGGLANGDSRPTLIDCTFIANVSSNKGGAMACGDGSPPMNNCSFINNRAVLGGAIYGGDSYPKATDCTFTGNSAEKGGVVYNRDSSILLTNCTLSGNRATEGGVIYDDEGGSNLINCVLTANTAITGGAIYSGNESFARLTNCALSGNEAESGGVAYICNESDVKIIHCTLAVNSADNGNSLACDSYQQQYPSSIEITNCILWNGDNEIWNNDGSIIAVTYSDVQGGWPGEGNIDAEPFFIEPGYWCTDGVWVEGDYRLRAASACIDAGTDAGIYEDIKGNVRPFDIPGVDNNGELPDFDMGAYEAVATMQGELLIQPNIVNLNARSKKIFVVVHLPEPIVGDDIDVSEPYVLYPGRIEADEQKLLLSDETDGDGVRIRAVFDRTGLLAAMPDQDNVEVTVIGRFLSGEYFYGTDNIRVVSTSR